MLKNKFLMVLALMAVTILFSYKKYLYSKCVGMYFPKASFSTFSNTEISVPLQQGVTWIAIWDFNQRDSISFLRDFDRQLKKGVLPPQSSFAILIAPSQQRSELARLVDQVELSSLIGIDEQNKISQVLWKWMPRPALLAVGSDGKILWAGSASDTLPKF